MTLLESYTGPSLGAQLIFLEFDDEAQHFVAQDVETYDYDEELHPRDEHGHFINTAGEPISHSNKPAESLTRGQLLERLKTNGYKGPTSFTKTQLVQIVHQHEATTHPGPKADAAAAGKPQAETPKVEGVQHGDKPIESLGRTQLLERLKSGGYTGPTSYTADKLRDILREHEGKGPAQPRDHTAASVYPTMKGTTGAKAFQDAVAKGISSSYASKFGQAGGAKATVASKLTERLGAEHQMALIEIGGRIGAGPGGTLGASSIADKLTSDSIWQSTFGGPQYVGTGADALASVGPITNIGGQDMAGGKVILRGDDPQLRQGLAEKGTSELIRTWASTSNDDHPRSLAIQDAAAKEFGLEQHQRWEVEGKVTNIPNPNYDSEKPSFTTSTNPVENPRYLTVPLEQAIKQETEKNGALYQAFVRAQYDETQKFLKENNIKQVTLMRGMSFGWGGKSAPPEWAKDVPQKQSWVKEHVAPKLVSDISLRPLSSFATSVGQANKFGNIRIKTTMPAERILSCPATGFGCLNEHEVVVIGGPGEYEVLKK